MSNLIFEFSKIKSKFCLKRGDFKKMQAHSHIGNICYAKETILLKTIIKIETYQTSNGLKEIHLEEICNLSYFII